jgi:hypothetical protein
LEKGLLFPPAKQHEPRIKMKTRLLHECDSFGRSLIFWKTNLADIPPGSAGTGYYAKFGADNTALAQGGALQKPSRCRPKMRSS